MICTDLICADKILFDAFGKLSLIDYLEAEIVLVKVPARISFMVASIFRKENANEEPNIEIGIFLNNKKTGSYNINLNFQSNDLPAKSVLSVRDIEISEQGVLDIIPIDKNNSDRQLFKKTILLGSANSDAFKKDTPK